MCWNFETGDRITGVADMLHNGHGLPPFVLGYSNLAGHARPPGHPAPADSCVTDSETDLLLLVPTARGGGGEGRGGGVPLLK